MSDVGGGGRARPVLFALARRRQGKGASNEQALPSDARPSRGRETGKKVPPLL